MEDKMAVQYEEDFYTLVNTPENMRAMLAEIEERSFMLADHQVKFCRSLGAHLERTGNLSAAQFKWLVIYYNEAASSSDMLQDPATER